MPKKKTADAPEPEEEVKEAHDEQPVDDAFKARASGKFDEEAVPADAPEKIEDDPDPDLADDEPASHELEVHEPVIHEETPQVVETEKASDDFDFSPPKRENGSKKLLWVVVILVLLGIGIAGGFLMFKSSLPGMAPATPSPEPTMEAPLVPTPAPELDRSELNIQVQNGSGTPGAAGEAQAFLEELGYKIGGTKNAASYDYDETKITLKEDKMDYKEQLIKDLSSKYAVSDDVETLDEDSKFDAVIIIGEERGGE